MYILRFYCYKTFTIFFRFFLHFFLNLTLQAQIQGCYRGLRYSQRTIKRQKGKNHAVITATRLITRVRWCAMTECYGLHCLFKSMLGGLCSFTKEGQPGSKASEAKAAKKVLQTQLSLWPEGIPADTTLCTRDPGLLPVKAAVKRKKKEKKGKKRGACKSRDGWDYVKTGVWGGKISGVPLYSTKVK